MGNSSPSKTASPEPIKVLFCGRGNFEAGFTFTKALLDKHKHIKVHYSDIFIVYGQHISNYYFSQVVNCEKEDVSKEIVDCQVVVPFMCRIRKNEIEHAPRLSLIMQFGVGLEGVDIDSATKAGVFVCKIDSESTGNAHSCAEHALYLTFSCFRNPSEMAESIKVGMVGRPLGRTLIGSTALIYGYGGIAKQLLKRLLPFELRRICIVQRILNPPNESLPDNVIFGDVSNFTEFAATADVVYLCCNQNTETMGMVDKGFLSAMKQRSVLINVARVSFHQFIHFATHIYHSTISRSVAYLEIQYSLPKASTHNYFIYKYSKGGLLNYADVTEALESGHLGGVGIDVFHTEPFPSDDPFLHHPKVVCTPHVAGVTELSYQNMAERVAENVYRLSIGKPLLGAVNNPILEHGEEQAAGYL